jgi:hypothetical protein
LEVLSHLINLFDLIFLLLLVTVIAQEMLIRLLPECSFFQPSLPLYIRS